MKNAIKPTRSDDFAEWYQQVVIQSELAENSPVRGCMVIRPYGYSIWENIQRELDQKLKQTGHVNAYFPLLMPISFLQKEADHINGFAKECAVVTHHRLEQTADGKLLPSGELEEPLVIRPTSELLVGMSFAKWIQSYRDLPILINQWSNVLRWEMRPRLFLRTSEFLWQEGHTAHSCCKQALEETQQIIGIYEALAMDHLAMPVIKGSKCTWERFPGAASTHTIEAMMQDGKALQAGTSHFLGQNFARAANIKFTNKSGISEFVWTTSWGVSTRLIGAMIMTHGDDNGLVIPPLIAPIQIVIIPIVHKIQDADAIYAYCNALKEQLISNQIKGQTLRVNIDQREINGGEKKWYHIKRGVPIHIDIGIQELIKNVISITRRDSSHSTMVMQIQEFIKKAPDILLDIQNSMLKVAQERVNNNTKQITSRAEFFKSFQQKDRISPFVIAPFIEDYKIKAILGESGVTVRCLPYTQPKDKMLCMFTGKPTSQWALYAKAY